MTTADSRIDVLIPHYNDPTGLKLSLDSIAAQDWPGTFRVVVSDDGSTIENKKGLHRIVEEHDQDIVLIDSRENRGRPYTRNTLLDAVDSPFLAWLDAGDEWYAGKTTKQMNLLANLEHNAGCWVTCNYDWKWIGAQEKHCSQSVNTDQLMALLVGRQLRAYLWTVIAPSSTFRIVGWFDEKLPRLQDLDYFLRFVTKGGVIRKPEGNEPLCVYHKSDSGRDSRQIRDCFDYIFHKHRALYRIYGTKFERSRLFEMDLLAARVSMKNMDFQASSFYLGKAFARKPASFVKKAALSRGKF